MLVIKKINKLNINTNSLSLYLCVFSAHFIGMRNRSATTTTTKAVKTNMLLASVGHTVHCRCTPSID